MEINIIDLPMITIIGKEGLCTTEKNIVQQLWHEANTHFNESRSFRPWTHQFTRGLYLAGVETYADAIAPERWTKWVMPARKYIVVDVEPNRYGEIFDEVINHTISEKGMKLAGAVCDYTEPATGKNKLFFPVESL